MDVSSRFSCQLCNADIPYEGYYCCNRNRLYCFACSRKTCALCYRTRTKTELRPKKSLFPEVSYQRCQGCDKMVSSNSAQLFEDKKCRRKYCHQCMIYWLNAYYEMVKKIGPTEVWQDIPIELGCRCEFPFKEISQYIRKYCYHCSEPIKSQSIELKNMVLVNQICYEDLKNYSSRFKYTKAKERQSYQLIKELIRQCSGCDQMINGTTIRLGSQSEGVYMCSQCVAMTQQQEKMYRSRIKTPPKKLNGSQDKQLHSAKKAETDSKREDLKSVSPNSKSASDKKKGINVFSQQMMQHLSDSAKKAESKIEEAQSSSIAETAHLQQSFNKPEKDNEPLKGAKRSEYQKQQEEFSPKEIKLQPQQITIKKVELQQEEQEDEFSTIQMVTIQLPQKKSEVECFKCHIRLVQTELILAEMKESGLKKSLKVVQTLQNLKQKDAERHKHCCRSCYYDLKVRLIREEKWKKEKQELDRSKMYKSVSKPLPSRTQKKTDNYLDSYGVTRTAQKATYLGTDTFSSSSYSTRRSLIEPTKDSNPPVQKATVASKTQLCIGCLGYFSIGEYDSTNHRCKTCLEKKGTRPADLMRQADRADSLLQQSRFSHRRW